MPLYYMGPFTPVIWSTIAWTEKFNNGLCTHFLQLRGLKSSRNSSCLKNRRCELSIMNLKGCSHGTIMTAMNLSQLIGCMGFRVIVAITQCEHLH